MTISMKELIKKLDDDKNMSLFIFYMSNTKKATASASLIHYLVNNLGYEGNINFDDDPGLVDNLWEICHDMITTPDNFRENIEKRMTEFMLKYPYKCTSYPLQLFHIMLGSLLSLYTFHIRELWLKECQRCHRSFAPNKINQKFCSLRCKNAQGQVNCRNRKRGNMECQTGLMEK